MNNFYWRFSQVEKKNLDFILTKGLNFKGKSYRYLLEKLWSNKTKKKYSITFNSCTSALHSSFLALNIKKGSEVLVPALTPIMCSTSVHLGGFVPVYVDVDPETFLIDYQDLEKKITKNTSAILAVHMYSGVCNLKKLKSICKKNNLYLVEDCAEAFGSRDQSGNLAGTVGDISCWSFQTAKHLTCGDGGIATTNNSTFAKRLRKIGNLGFSTLQAKNEQNSIPKKVRQHPNFNRFDSLGYNYRLNEFSCAIALGQIANAKRLIKLRKTVGIEYLKVCKKYFNFIQVQKIHKPIYSTYYTFGFYLKNSKVTWSEFRKIFLKFGGKPFYAASKLCNQEAVIINLKIGRCYNTCKNNCLKKCNGTPVAKNLQKRLILLTTNQSNKADIKKQALALKKTLDYFFRNSLK